MNTLPPPAIVFSPGPGATFILLCSCGNLEVSRDRRTWRRFRPRFPQDRSRCLACHRDAPLTHNADPCLHRARRARPSPGAPGAGARQAGDIS